MTQGKAFQFGQAAPVEIDLSGDTVAALARAGIGADGLPERKQEQAAPPSAPAVVTAAASTPSVLRVSTAPSAETSFDVLRAARERRRYLRQQIKLLRKLEKEERELTRLLDAAKRPVASVRKLERTG